MVSMKPTSASIGILKRLSAEADSPQAILLLDARAGDDSKELAINLGQVCDRRVTSGSIDTGGT